VVNTCEYLTLGCGSEGRGFELRRSPCDMQVKRLRGSSTPKVLRLIFKWNVDRRMADEDRSLR
jgi:hypothetical protein